MAYLKAYVWERDRWPQFQTVRLSYETAQKIVKKLCRHFDVPQIPVYQQGYSVSCYRFKRYTSSWASYINLAGKSHSLGIVCHEFAHHLTFSRWRNGNRHNRQFKRELKRTYTWAKRYLPN